MKRKPKYLSKKEPGIKVQPWVFVPFMVLLAEMLLHLWTNQEYSAGRVAAVAAFALGFGGILALITSFFPAGAAKWIGLLLAAVWIVLCMVEYFIYDAFHYFMAVETMLVGAGGVADTFSSTVVSLVVNNLWRILLVLVPVVLYIIFVKPKKTTWKLRGILAAAVVLVYAAAFGIVNIVGTDAAILNNQYSFDNAIRAFGLNTAMALNVVESKTVGGDDLSFEVVQTPTETTRAAETTAAEETEGTEATEETTVPVETEPPVVYEPHTLGLDFAQLAEEERNSNISAMHTYVASQTPAMENEYTGLFEGKNLIFITAEAFTGVFIDPELTPTLYRLSTQGIRFTNYYQPGWGAGTTGGEFSNLVGQIPNDGACMKETFRQNLFVTIGRQLQSLGYSSAAFHNNSYKYYDRHLTHTYLGYDYYMGYGNGIEDGVTPVWPQSDLEMIDFTVPLYIDQQPFSVYYMSVSGHSTYSQDSNAMARKNYDLVADLDCSETIKCYIASQLELENALTSLLAQLEEAGIMDDTVIVVASDHYPYGLEESSTWSSSKDYLAELFGEKVSNEFIRDRNCLIIWSGCIEDMDIVVEDPVFSLDILPTLSNLFGVEYDSRLYVGRDVFSDDEPVIFWTTYSWMTDKGTYLASTGTFTPNEGVEVDEDYVERISAIVRNRIKYSKNVSYNDYFTYVYEALEELWAAEGEPTEESNVS